jgi:3-isopropylmalate/(R)-2-methylmalate dehydratase large subunit
MAQTLFDKIWNTHVVSRNSGFPDALYIDKHYISKATSPQAFEGLRKRNIPVFRTKQTFVIGEPEYSSHIPMSELTRFQSDLLNRNCNDFGLDNKPVSLLNFNEEIAALPGQTIVCDYDNTDNMGAFGALAIGIGETQVEQVLATQCLLQQKPKQMKIEVNGRLAKGLSVKDIIHYLIAEIPADNANGYFIEFGGDTILSLDMEGRIAICNMSKEIGAIGGIIALDDTTINYIKELALFQEGDYSEEYLASWGTLYSDEFSVFDEVLEFDAEDITPGNYGIGISKLISFNTPSRKGVVAYESAGILEGYNDTDYILSRKQIIEEFERSNSDKIFNGV